MSQRPPRIVHVYKDLFPPVEGGIERIIHHLALRAENDFDVRVIVAARNGPGATHTVGRNVQVIEVPCRRRLMSTPIAPGFFSALKRSQADLFHFHIPHPTGELAYLLSGLSTPAVATYHSDVVRQRIAMIAYGPLFEKFLSRLRVIMPTSTRYLDSSPWLQRHRARCRVVPLGYPLEDYVQTPAVRQRADQLRSQHGNFVFFLGCLRSYKGLPFLIQAAAKLPVAKVLIAGDGPLRAELETMASQAGVRDRVLFLGHVDPAEAVALLHAASLFVLPSHQRSEAFGLCQIEAMACGLPVISCDLPTGVPEVNRHEETGLIVPPADADALAAAMGRLLANPDQRAAMGAAGRRRAEALYRDTRMAADVAAVYREVLETGD